MGRTIDIDDIMKKKGTKLMDIRNGKYVDENNMPIWMQLTIFVMKYMNRL